MATVHRDPRGKSPYWYAYFTDSNGKRRCTSTKEVDKHKAKLKCAQWQDKALALRNDATKDAQAIKVMNRILETSGNKSIPQNDFRLAAGMAGRVEGKQGGRDQRPLCHGH